MGHSSGHAHVSLALAFTWSWIALWCSATSNLVISGHIWHVSSLCLRAILLAKDDAKSTMSFFPSLVLLITVTTLGVSAVRLLWIESEKVLQAWSLRVIQCSQRATSEVSKSPRLEVGEASIPPI